jgi:hypothetical protein
LGFISGSPHDCAFVNFDITLGLTG